MIGANVPIGDGDRFAAQVAALDKRIGDLERTAGRFPGAAGPPVGVGPNGRTYYDTKTKRLWRSNGTAWIFEKAYDPAQRPGVSLAAASQAVGSLSTVAASWTTETLDVDNWITAPSTTLTVPAGWGGCYIATLRTSWSSSTTVSMESILSVNGTVALNAAGNAAFAIRSLSGEIRVAAGDTITASGFNTTGGSLNMTNTLLLNWLSA